MDWWEVEENDWFEKYLPGQDLPDSLDWTPFSVDLTTDPDVPTRMYPGLVSRGTVEVCHTVPLTSYNDSERAYRT